MKSFFALGAIASLLFASGCGDGGSNGSSDPGGAAQARLELREAKRHAAHRRAVLRHRAQARARREAARQIRLKAQRERRSEARQARAEEAEAMEAEEAAATEESSCDPNYSGACLDPYASDYDCADGEGDGPAYTGTVTVIGEDHYGLDADSDGIGCELN